MGEAAPNQGITLISCDRLNLNNDHTPIVTSPPQHTAPGRIGDEDSGRHALGDAFSIAHRGRPPVSTEVASREPAPLKSSAPHLLARATDQQTTQLVRACRIVAQTTLRRR